MTEQSDLEKQMADAAATLIKCFSATEREAKRKIDKIDLTLDCLVNGSRQRFLVRVMRSDKVGNN